MDRHITTYKENKKGSKVTSDKWNMLHALVFAKKISNISSFSFFLIYFIQYFPVEVCYFS